MANTYSVDKVDPKAFGVAKRPFWVTIEHREGLTSRALDAFATKREALEAVKQLRAIATGAD